MTQRVKVKTALLREKVTAFITKQEELQQLQVEEYETAAAGYSDAVKDALRLALEEAIEGKLPKFQYDHVDVMLEKRQPNKPTENRDLTLARKTLEMLRMSGDETQVLATDSEWVKYL